MISTKITAICCPQLGSDPVTRPFAPVPMNGMFTTSRAKVIEQCTKAHKAARFGAFVSIRGWPCVVVRIEFRKDPGADVEATIHYRRIRDKRALTPSDMTTRH